MADCIKTLKSWADAEKCIAPEDAQCKKITSGAWGCVFTYSPSYNKLSGESNLDVESASLQSAAANTESGGTGVPVATVVGIVAVCCAAVLGVAGYVLWRQRKVQNEMDIGLATTPVSQARDFNL